MRTPLLPLFSFQNTNNGKDRLTHVLCPSCNYPSDCSLFLHIRYHPRNNALEITKSITTNNDLQSTCDMRLPVIFDAPRQFRGINVDQLSQTQLARCKPFLRCCLFWIHSGLITDGAFTGTGIGTEATEDTIFSKEHAHRWRRPSGHLSW
jgi:hypothetical protein